MGDLLPSCCLPALLLGLFNFGVCLCLSPRYVGVLGLVGVTGVEGLSASHVLDSSTLAVYGLSSFEVNSILISLVSENKLSSLGTDGISPCFSTIREKMEELLSSARGALGLGLGDPNICRTSIFCNPGEPYEGIEFS